jgi:hypothetical protein
MKKLLCLFAVLFAVVSYAQDEPVGTEYRDWEVVPGIISGGYNDQEGAYIYKFFGYYTCTTLVYDRTQAWYSHYYQAIINIGYGEFQKYGGGSLIIEDTKGGEVSKVNDDTWALSYTAMTEFPEEYIDGLAPAYIYKKEAIQSMSIAFSSDSYTAQEGQKLTVNVFVVGGSGHYYGQSVKPVFLSTVGLLAYEGICHEPVQTSISVIVKDRVTGQQCAASADIIITEKNDDNNNSGTSGTSGTSNDPGGTSSDPGGTATDPGSSDSSGDDGTSVGDGDTGDTSGDDGSDDGGDAVDPGNSDDDPATEPDDSSSDDNEADDGSDNSGTGSTATDPGSSDSTDSSTDTSNADNSDSTSDTSDTSDSSGDDDVVVVVPDGTDTPDTSDSSDISDISDGEDITSDDDTSDAVIISDTTEDDEPTVIVINDSTTSDTDTIVVTDDSVTTTRRDNYDLAIFMSMFGAITGLNGSMVAPQNTSMAVQEARGGKGHE